MYVPLNVNLENISTLANGRHIMSGNVQIFIKDGKKHRENGPAEIRPDGYKAWFRDGLKHREDGPAVIYPSGTEEYWTKGQLLRRLNNGNNSGDATT